MRYRCRCTALAMSIICCTNGSQDKVPSMITSRPSLRAVTRSEDAASIDDWCTSSAVRSMSLWWPLVLMAR
uniref:Uncharacterized protein n=1 Tax=Arundo donax TaxID=35708 RepID=A0A0A9HBI5_ARUDO